MKRIHRQAMRAAARERDEPDDDDDEDAAEAMGWHDEWAQVHEIVHQNEAQHNPS